MTRSPPLLWEGMWRELHRPQAEMLAGRTRSGAPLLRSGLIWLRELPGPPLVVHNGAIDGFTVHRGFLPETGQGLILLTNRDPPLRR